MNRNFFFALSLCLVLGLGTLQAQSLAISGTVSDGVSPVPAAAISLRAPSGASTGGQTDAEGKYRFDSLIPGPYEVIVTVAGFAKSTHTLSLATEDGVVDVTLQLSGVSTTVEVTDVVGRASASRMDISDRELPNQVSTITRETLDSQGTNDLVTALQNASGVSARVQYGVYEQYTVRGSGSTVQLLDGVRVEGNRVNTQLNNVERVDVLKGPSSVLYGGGVFGGAINVVRKKPQGQRAYDLSFRTGRFGLTQVGGGATGLLFWNRLMYRVDSMFENSSGWRGAGSRRFNVSPSITWLITDKARVTFYQGLTRDRYNLDAGIPLGLFNTKDFALDTRFNTVQDFEHNNDSQSQIFFDYNITPRFQFRDTFFYNRKGDQYYHAETLAYVPALNQVNRTALYFYHHRKPVQNQSDFLGRVDLGPTKHYFMTGFEYQNFFTATDRSAGRSVPLPPINLANPGDTYVPVPDFPLTSQDRSEIVNRSFYWQDIVTLTKRIKLNIGGRYQDYQRAAHSEVPTNGVMVRGAETRRHNNAYTYRAGLIYSLTESQEAYFTSNSSFIPNTTIPADNRELLPEIGQSFEIGHRWQTLHGRLRLSSAIYKNTSQNVTVNLGSGLYTQAGQASSRGADFDLNGDIGWGFRLLGNYGYSLSKYDEYFSVSGGVTTDLSGRIRNYVPRHTANLWLSKSWKSGFYTNFGPRYMGSVFLNDANTARLGGWMTFKASAGLARRQFDWSVNAENLFGRERYIVSTLGSSGAQVFPGTAINIYTTIRFRFQ